MCMYVHMYAYTIQSIWVKVRNNVGELVLSYHVGPRDQIHIIRTDSKNLLSHLASPNCMLLKVISVSLWLPNHGFSFSHKVFFYLLSYLKFQGRITAKQFRLFRKTSPININLWLTQTRDSDILGLRPMLWSISGQHQPSIMEPLHPGGLRLSS